ncbi:hypothetical protein [Hymenobacter cellulosilyticus]|uniref:Imidazolonepropionase n=1 Tax=Hymenobacter cellulosilyticus TaxID=2932248 RepID=A0A8T9Q2X4_9BACT|nr:hypothetical protein [Hymenobacter cellulosilyticus]UOQ70130.1 hypothetical protein MUN79_15290 [Hymenobacter cellulosilyticus]
MPYSLLIRNCGQLLTLTGGPTYRPLVGPDLASWLILENAFIACENGLIVALGPMAELDETQVTAQTQVLDARGGVVMPGLVECHTHLVFAGNRAQEFQRKLQGESYLDILASGAEF